MRHAHRLRGTPLGFSQRVTPYGALAPGILADFVVLGGDPLTADPARLGSLPVRATYAGGAKVWDAAGADNQTP